jgi:hypothetical protein
VADPESYDGIVPFLIDWGDTTDPAAFGLPMIELLEFAAAHPQPAAVNAVLQSLALVLRVSECEAALTATVSGPAGTVQLR